MIYLCWRWHVAVLPGTSLTVELWICMLVVSCRHSQVPPLMPLCCLLSCKHFTLRCCCSSWNTNEAMQKVLFTFFLSAGEAKDKPNISQVAVTPKVGWTGWEIIRESVFSVAAWPLHLTVQRQSLRGLLDLQNWRWAKLCTCEMTECGSAGVPRRPRSRQWSLNARHLTSIPACPCTAPPVPLSLDPTFKDVYIIFWRDHRVGNALFIILQCEYLTLIALENEK